MSKLQKWLLVRVRGGTRMVEWDSELFTLAMNARRLMVIYQVVRYNCKVLATLYPYEVI
jgi:hypothetical protein